jgi:hypothetical protein
MYEIFTAKLTTEGQILSRAAGTYRQNFRVYSNQIPV